MRNNICIIPARGGSKRIPQKNIRPFFGKPMLAWSIEAAKNAGCFERIIISTDDPDIAEVARGLGAEAPFERPSELADDYTGTADVIKHAIGILAATGCEMQNVCCLYATAPFIQSSDLRKALLKLDHADFVIPVVESPGKIERALRVSENGTAKMISPENYMARTQDLEPTFFDPGQFYWGARDAWLSPAPFFNHTVSTIVLPIQRTVDIDTPEDWKRAEQIFKFLHGERS